MAIIVILPCDFENKFVIMFQLIEITIEDHLLGQKIEDHLLQDSFKTAISKLSKLSRIPKLYDHNTYNFVEQKHGLVTQRDFKGELCCANPI